MSALGEELEQLVIGDWPAAESAPLDGWLLRYSAGVTHRGNSVAAGTRLPGDALDCSFGEVERWYGARDLSPCFQVFDHAPPALDNALAARGYEAVFGSWVQTADCRTIDGTERAVGLSAQVRDTRDAEWLSIAAGRSRFASDVRAFEGFVDRIGARAGHAIAHLDGVPIAAGLGVLSPCWLGVYAMVTVPEARRRGAARALVDALFAWASASGVQQAYLLVGQDNHGSIELYRRAGFTTQARYWYRQRKLEGDRGPSGC